MNDTTLAAPCAHARKGILLRLLYAARNLRSGAMFAAMRRYSRGNVLDIGGLDFFVTAVEKGIAFDHWTTVEPSPENMPHVDDPRFSCVVCDGCDMKPVASDAFDTVLCIQVVEHVMDPNAMVSEISRVLKRGGHAIVLAPQTSTLHMVPHHYYNFTRYWIEEIAKRNGLTIVEFRALGGRWSSTASHMVYFVLQAMGMRSLRVPGLRRSVLHYVLLPLQLLTAVVLIPWCLLLSIGDLEEEANNHLVVLRKGNA